MTDAETVRVAALFHYDMTGNRDALAALDRLVAERALYVEMADKWQAEAGRLGEVEDELVAERDRLRETLARVEETLGRVVDERDNWHASNHAERQARLAAEAERDKALRTVETLRALALPFRDLNVARMNLEMASAQALPVVEAERDRLREALERIARPHTNRLDASMIARLAREALGGHQ